MRQYHNIPGDEYAAFMCSEYIIGMTCLKYISTLLIFPPNAKYPKTTLQMVMTTLT